MLKKIGFVFIILIIILVVMLIIIRKPKTLKLTIIKEAYHYTTLKDDTQFYINLYVNQQNSYLTDTTKLNSCYLSDELETNMQKINIDKILLVNENDIDNQVYYKYEYQFGINCVDDFLIKDAYLILNYQNGIKAKIDIGSFSLYRIHSLGDDNLSISSLKGIVNTVDGKKTLVGMVIGLNNNTNSEIIVNQITMLDQNIICGEPIIIKNETINPNDDISQLLGYNYQLTNNQTNYQGHLAINEGSIFLFPLHYCNHYEIPNVGLKIDYTVNNEPKTYYYENFTFFTNHNRQIPISDLTFYLYESD